jgi:sulfate permease, SulP family
MRRGSLQYRRSWLRPDLMAGLTSAAVVIPKSMAYATIAGLPVQVGLYTAFVPPLIYAILGTSRPLSVAATTTIAVLTGAELGEAVPSGDPAMLLRASALLTLMVGAALLLASVLRLGFIANFISEPVLVGFKAGIGAVIVLDQLPHILGIHVATGTFLHKLASIGPALSQLSLPTLLLGMLTIIGLASIEKLRPRWPAPLIAMAVAIAAVYLFALRSYGVELVGAIPTGLPPVTPPDLALASELWPGAVGIALMSFTETAAAGRAFARSDEPPPRTNVELFALGMANAAGAFVGSMPAGGGVSQTAVSRMTGARTQLAGIFRGLTALTTMLLLSPLLGLVPHAALAAIVIVYSVRLIQPTDFRAILRIRRTEFIWAVAAFLGVMLLGSLRGILVAIVVSLFALAQQAANPRVYVLVRKPGTNVFRSRSPQHPEDERFPGLLLLRLEGRIFFLNCERIGELMRPLVAEAKPKVIVLDLSRVFDLEYSALKMLTQAEERQRKAGVTLWLAGLNPEVLAMVQRSALGNTLGRERLMFNLEIAVGRYLALQKASGAVHE